MFGERQGAARRQDASQIHFALRSGRRPSSTTLVAKQARRRAAPTNRKGSPVCLKIPVGGDADPPLPAWVVKSRGAGLVRGGLDRFGVTLQDLGGPAPRTREEAVRSRGPSTALLEFPAAAAGTTIIGPDVLVLDTGKRTFRAGTLDRGSIQGLEPMMAIPDVIIQG